MARCLCIRRISLGEMYQRLRRASLRIRSFMTCFLKRFSKASCDSPSLRLTVANALTPLQSAHLDRPTLRPGHTKPGFLTHLLDGSRADTDLANWPCQLAEPRVAFNTLASVLSGISARRTFLEGWDGDSASTRPVYMVSFLLN